MRENSYRYFAFVSYSSADARWGRRLQRRLEGYRMPATLCSEHGWERRPMKPIFFAPTDIQPGDLGEELKARLRASRNLIVIASPRSAQSEWVAKEIAYFHSLPQGNKIFFFIVAGKPMSGDPQTECYNPVIHHLGMSEPLGVNIHEHVYRIYWMNRERAYIQLITKLLGIEFDELWQRHHRRQRQQTALWCMGILLTVLTAAHLIRANGTTEVSLTLVEATPHNEYLDSRRDAVVRLWVDDEERRDTLKDETSNTVLFGQVPHRLLGKDVRVRFDCNDFVPIDTVLTLTEQVMIPYCRDANLFGHVEFVLVDKCGNPLANRSVTVGNVSGESDSFGGVRLDIPIEHQRPHYAVSSTIPLRDTVLFMPCGGSGLTIKAI